MNYLKFKYRLSENSESERTVSPWVELGHYIEGIDMDLDRICYFRKDLISKYLEEGLYGLADPHPAPPPRINRSLNTQQWPSIRITGFRNIEQEYLEILSSAGGLRIVSRHQEISNFLCAGPEANVLELSKSRKNKTYIISQQELAEFLETGYAPDYALY